MKPDRHYEHKQHAFDSYCKKVLKYEAYNGYREISRRQKCEALFSELSEEKLAQLAVYDRYSWEYTAFPVGGAVILIEDDRLAEALNALPQNNRDIFLMYWFPGYGRPRDRRVHEHGPPDGQHPQAESLSAAEGADGR
ncbi:MAG: sigma-70 family RNA polymerase sigma factor [Oscillibacter sp.]